MLRFVISIFLIPIGLFSGIGIKKLVRRKQREEDIPLIRRRLQQLALLIINPIAILGAIWALPLEDLKIISLPFLEITAIVLGGTLSLLYSRRAGMENPRKGSHFCLCFYSNIGSLGALVVYALLGEPGFIFLSFYKMFEEFMYYAIGFPMASRFGKYHKKESGSLRRVLKDPFVIFATSAMIAGLALNITGLPRPAFYTTFNSIMVPVISFSLLCSIGLGFDFRGIMKHAESLGSVFFIRYIVVAGTISFLAWALGLGGIQNGLPLKTVFILCFMPTGFLSAILPGLYGLDEDYGNAGLVATMLFLIPAVPGLYFGINYLIPLLINHPLF